MTKFEVQSCLNTNRSKLVNGISWEGGGGGQKRIERKYQNNGFEGPDKTIDLATSWHWI